MAYKIQRTPYCSNLVCKFPTEGSLHLAIQALGTYHGPSIRLRLYCRVQSAILSDARKPLLSPLHIPLSACPRHRLRELHHDPTLKSRERDSVEMYLLLDQGLKVPRRALHLMGATYRSTQDTLPHKQDPARVAQAPAELGDPHTAVPGWRSPTLFSWMYAGSRSHCCPPPPGDVGASSGLTCPMRVPRGSA